MVPPGVDEAHTKRPQPTMLRVTLLQITQPTHELFAGDVLVVGQQVALGGLAGVVDEDVGVGGHARHGADHVVVEDVELLGRRVLLEELGGDFALGGEDDAVLGEDTDGGAGVGDGLEGVLDLVQPALWREDGSSGIVAARHLDGDV